MTRPGGTPIRIELEDASLSAELNDSAAARDFRALLPLTLTLEDYASKEKIADLPRKLDTSGAPAGTAGAVGDIAYYAPWGNLAIFYHAAPHAAGLVTLGRVSGDVGELRGRTALQVTILANEA